MTDVAAEGTSPPTESGSPWQRGPGRLFHLALVIPTLIWLWSWSVPGFNFLLWTTSALALGIGAILWGGRLLTYLLARFRGRQTGGGQRFLVAPVCGVLALGLVIADAPLEARWALSRADFDAVVDVALTDDTYSSIEDQRLGLYTVTHVYRVGDAVIFYERTGSFSDDAGFAYLPDGPFPELESSGFERPQFRHLGGPWYAWTASW